MALFSNLQLTDAGQQAVNAYILGSTKTPIALTAIAIGDGAKPANPAAQTSLVREVKRLAVETSELEKGVLTVTARLSTDTITADITHREIGLFSGSTLFAYANAGDDYDYIPAAGQNTAVVKLITVRITVGTIEVKLETLPADDYVTYAGLEQRVKREVADTVPNEVQTNFNRELPNAVKNEIKAQIPDATAAELKKQLPDATTKELTKQLPDAVENEVHTLIDNGRVNEIVNEEVIQELNTATVTTFSTPEGTGTQLAKFVQISGEHTTLGRLDHITLDTRPNVTTEVNSYLLVWEQDETGGWSYCGTSHNNPRLQNAQPVHYDFRGVEIHGRALRLALVPTQEGGWQPDTFVPFTIFCSPATTGDMKTGDTITPPTGNAVRKIATVTLGICAPRYTPYAHYLDGDSHLQDGERPKWDAAAADIAAHKADNAQHLQPGERDNWNEKPTNVQVDTKIANAKTALQEEIRSRLASVLSWRGSVATVDALPKEGQQKGDVYDVKETGSNYAWTGEEWDDLGPTLTGFLKTEIFNAHDADAVRHVDAPTRAKWDAKPDAAAVQETVTNALLEDVEVTDSTGEGGTDANARYLQVAGSLVPTGTVTGIAIKCRGTENNQMATEAAFLAVWEKNEGDDNYTRLVSSTAAVQQAVGETREWTFDELELHGRTIRLVFLAEADSPWPGTNQSWQHIGVSVGARGEGDTESSYIGPAGNSNAYCPSLSFRHIVRMDKFAHRLTDAQASSLAWLVEHREALQTLIPQA